MSDFIIDDGEREQVKLVMLEEGVTGVGKTYTGLLLASYMLDAAGPQPWMKDKICVIDSDNGRSKRYNSGKPFYFRVLEMAHKDPATGARTTRHSPEDYIKAYDQAVRAGFQWVIIDSTSDEWQWVIEESERMAKGERNKERIWGVLTPKHNAFLRKITSGAVHTIATCLMKPAYETVEVNGKKQKQRVADSPVQREGIERLFDIVVVIEEGCIMRFRKTLCSELDNAIFEKPGADLAKILQRWLSDGEEYAPATVEMMVDMLVSKLATCGSQQDSEPIYAQLNKWCVTRGFDYEPAKAQLRKAAVDLLKRQKTGADQSEAPPTPRPTQQSATNT